MFNSEDVVLVKDRGIGTIEQIAYDYNGNRDIYIVQLRETKDLLKCLEEDLSPVIENVETITISKVDYINAIANIDYENIVEPYGKTALDTIFGDMLGKFVTALCIELFDKKAEND